VNRLWKALSLCLVSLSFLTTLLVASAEAGGPATSNGFADDAAASNPKFIQYWLEKDSNLGRTNPQDKSSKFLLYASTLNPATLFYPNLELVRRLTTNCQDAAARKFIERVRLKYPGGAEATVLEGVVAQEKVQPEVAKVCFLKALEAKKYYGPGPLSDGALGLQAIGCTSDAIKMLERASQLDPSAQNHFAWGICLLDVGRYKEAQQHLRKHPAITAGTGYVLRYLIEADCKAKDWAGAIEDSKDIDKMHGDRSFTRKILELRGDSFTALGRYQEAIVAYTGAIKLLEAPVYLRKRAECYKALGQSALAAKDTKRMEQLSDY